MFNFISQQKIFQGFYQPSKILSEQKGADHCLSIKGSSLSYALQEGAF
jgi:hypothetical protein